MKKAPASTYLLEPRGAEMKKVKAKALKCCLASDGVLLGGMSEEGARPSLPVVPNVRYDEKVSGTPKQHTWKTFLLAASHNDKTSHHRTDELKNVSLVND